MLSQTTITNSWQINAEIIYAFENRKFFFPILFNVERKNVKEAQPDWIYCFGASTSIRIDSFDDVVALKKIDAGISMIQKASTDAVTDMESDRKLLISFLGRIESDVVKEVSSDVYKSFRVPASIDWFGFSLTWRTHEARGGDLEIFDDCILLQFIDNKVVSACFVKRIMQNWFDSFTGRPKIEFVEPIISAGITPFDKQVTNACLLNW